MGVEKALNPMTQKTVDGREGPGNQDRAQRDLGACEVLITLFSCKAGLLSEALAGPQIRARNPRTAIKRLSGLVTVFRVHLGRTQGPGLSFTRK